jgi:hypothetical protein
MERMEFSHITSLPDTERMLLHSNVLHTKLVP